MRPLPPGGSCSSAGGVGTRNGPRLRCGCVRRSCWGSASPARFRCGRRRRGRSAGCTRGPRTAIPSWNRRCTPASNRRTVAAPSRCWPRRSTRRPPHLSDGNRRSGRVARRLVEVDSPAGVSWQTLAAFSELPREWMFPGGAGEWFPALDGVGGAGGLVRPDRRGSQPGRPGPHPTPAPPTGRPGRRVRRRPRRGARLPRARPCGHRRRTRRARREPPRGRATGHDQFRHSPAAAERAARRGRAVPRRARLYRSGYRPRP